MAPPGQQPRNPLIQATLTLRSALTTLRFAPPVTHVYNPLDYAWPTHREYLTRYASPPKRIVFIGMNPGPFGMVQTGIPFGEINAVRDWMRITDSIPKPKHEHPRRPIQGFNCPRSEVSGRRLWGLFAKRYPNAKDFFDHHFVVNFCPLAFLEETGRNRTPDTLPAAELEPVYAACDQHLRQVIHQLNPEFVIGVGAFATKRAQLLFAKPPFQIGQILHPSPASPAANRDWAGSATRQLVDLGAWPA